MESTTFRSDTFFDDIAARDEQHVHLILIATKPDIIKQVPLYKELVARGHLAILGHTGQHYDDNLSGGMLREFGVEPDFNLHVRGSMHQVVSQIIDRLGTVIQELQRRGKTVIPYVHGDTTTAMAAANAGYCNAESSVHVEAGIRTLTPRYEQMWSTATPQAWYEYLLDRSHWEAGSQEPYPEQFNTRCAEAATGLHLAPVELDRSFLLAEGFAPDRIVVAGNSVVDATLDALERSAHSTIFEQYPQLASGNFVRFCIHRRENCIAAERFLSIIDAMEMLLAEGRTVLFINMLQTKAAIQRFGLEQRFQRMATDFPHFVCTDVWAEYGDVIAAMSRAAVCATDSGSMQEEMNVLGVPCVTLRFGSDRSESVMAGGNIIAPPVDTRRIHALIDFAWDNADMRAAPKLYGENVSSVCIDAVENLLRHGDMFRPEQQRLARHFAV